MTGVGIRVTVGPNNLGRHIRRIGLYVGLPICSQERTPLPKYSTAYAINKSAADTTIVACPAGPRASMESTGTSGQSCRATVPCTGSLAVSSRQAVRLTSPTIRSMSSAAGWCSGHGLTTRSR